MRRLTPDQFTILQPLFREPAAFNLSLKAVLAGTAPGEAWADDVQQPTLGLVNSSEGHYLAGDPNRTASFDGLKATIPDWAFLNVHPAGWGKVLSQIWVNDVARPQARQHYVLRQLRLRDWRQRLPAGFEVRRVNAVLLDQKHLKNLNVITRVIGNNWRSQDDFLQHGFGFCVVDVSAGAGAEALASCCVADCVCEAQAEVGIKTVPSYRKRGLASVVVAAMAEHCLANGFVEIGWHCPRANVGSSSTAQRVGFEWERDYMAYSDQLPSENASDLSVAEYADWAAHYERAIATKPQYVLNAACARALAGDADAALQHLRRVLESGERIGAEWLANHWSFASLKSNVAFQAMVAALSS